MICPLNSEDTFDVLLDYSAGKLNRAQAARLEQHRLLCADCSAFLAGQTELWQSLDVWEPEPVSMDFNRRLWQRIETEAAPSWGRRLADFFARGAWKPVLPLTAAAVMVIGGFMMDHQASVPAIQSAHNSVDVAAAVSETDAELVEKTLDDLQLLSQLDGSGGQSTTSKTM
jgi:hypothetical protein